MLYMRNLFLLLIFAVFLQVSAQNRIKNDFKIGMFQSEGYMLQNSYCGKIPYEIAKINNSNTSCLTILSEDGFNIHNPYYPNEWVSEKFMETFLQLSKANNLQVELSCLYYYKPTIDFINGSINYENFGENIYDNCGNTIDSCKSPYEEGFFRTNIKSLFNNILSNNHIKNVVWGIHLSEEAAAFHPFLFSNDCKTNGANWGDSTCFYNCEVPPTNVAQSIHYFIDSLFIPLNLPYKTIVMEAFHNNCINDTTCDTEGIYNPQNYIQLLDNNNRSVFFEGSYTQFLYYDLNQQIYNNMGNIANPHYLGPFKTIDYATKFSSNIHKVISIMGTNSEPDTDINACYLSHYHSDTLIQNANWLWFQAYTSIIHGAQGIWFWGLSSAWNNDYKDLNNYTKWLLNDTNSYTRENFPYNYNQYVAHLAKELRFLVNNNILSTDPSSIILSKTDNIDTHCILPLAISYIPRGLDSEKRNEKYGLRYTIRTNGTDSYMIITNPLNVPVSTELDFSNLPNQSIQNSIGIQFLFEDNRYPVTSNMYKVDRNSKIDLVQNLIEKTYFVPFKNSTKKIKISLGPLDVKVLKFVSLDSNDYNNGWHKIWSNYGNGKIGGHFIKDSDRFYICDYNGDGEEELLCVGYSDSGANDWITILKYINGSWNWCFSNYGDSSLFEGLYLYRNNLYVGDFDGDGKEELLGNKSESKLKLFKFNSNTIECIWTEGQNSNISSYKQNIYIGDFNGDNIDELLVGNNKKNKVAMFKWNGNDFYSIWENENTSPLLPYLPKLKVVNIDGLGGTELLGLSSWATLFQFDGLNWNWLWSNYGADNFNGWDYPLLSTDKLLIGNIDNDLKEEIFFIQTQQNAQWAQTMDFSQNNWSWNWSANPEYSSPYIGDWPLTTNYGENTNYFLIHTKYNHPKNLLAMRKFCNSYLLNMYEYSSNNNFKKSDFNFYRIEKNKKARIYPNPTTGKCNIVSLTDDLFCKIIIQDIYGKILFEKNIFLDNTIEIELSSFADGVYILTTMNQEGKLSNYKIIKQ